MHLNNVTPHTPAYNSIDLRLYVRCRKWPANCSFFLSPFCLPSFCYCFDRRIGWCCCCCCLRWEQFGCSSAMQNIYSVSHKYSRCSSMQWRWQQQHCCESILNNKSNDQNRRGSRGINSCEHLAMRKKRICFCCCCANACIMHKIIRIVSCCCYLIWSMQCNNVYMFSIFNFDVNVNVNKEWKQKRRRRKKQHSNINNNNKRYSSSGNHNHLMHQPLAIRTIKKPI